MLHKTNPNQAMADFGHFLSAIAQVHKTFCSFPYSKEKTLSSIEITNRLFLNSSFLFLLFLGTSPKTSRDAPSPRPRTISPKDPINHFEKYFVLLYFVFVGMEKLCNLTDSFGRHKKIQRQKLHKRFYYIPTTHKKAASHLKFRRPRHFVGVNRRRTRRRRRRRRHSRRNIHLPQFVSHNCCE